MTPKTHYLSKSQFTRGMQCSKSLWLYRKHRDLQDPTPPDLQARFDAGSEVGVLAHKWIPGGVLIKADHTDPDGALAETAKAIADGAQVIYEAAFLHDDVLVRVDILAKGPGGVWDLYEVKSTTGVEDVYLLDSAIQRYVVEGAGLQFGVGHVVHLNPSYVRYGALDLKHLFLAVDVNAETTRILPKVPLLLAGMKAVNAQPEAPDVPIGPHCTKPYDCSFQGHCWAKVPDYSVFNLAGARMDKKSNLWHAGHRLITDIPKCTCKPTAKKCTCGYRLTNYQEVQRHVALTGKPFINREAIAALLAQLFYPLHFLDFEAVTPPVPVYDGTRPYQALPFEASIHFQAAAGAPLEHFEYLCDGTVDPRPGLVEFLRKHVADRGSVIAYNKSYEGNMVKGMAAMQREGSQAEKDLLEIEKRLWDLADPFKQALWADPRFEGSWSIKKVLPVLVPDMTYDGLAIAEGTAAMRAYTRLMTETLSATERAQLMEDLRAYCGQDTMAMVRILAVAQATVATPAGA